MRSQSSACYNHQFSCSDGLRSVTALAKRCTNRAPDMRLPRHGTFSFDADFSPQHEHTFAGDDLWRRVRGGGVVLGCGGNSALALRDLCRRAPAAACSFQSPAPRGRPGNRLPLLSHFGRDLQLRRHSAHQDLHELPFADLDQCGPAGAGPRKLQERQIAGVDAGE